MSVNEFKRIKDFADITERFEAEGEANERVRLQSEYKTKEKSMTDQEKKEHLIYKQAIHHFPKCKDQELKAYYKQIIAEHDKKYPKLKLSRIQIPKIIESDGRELV